MKWKMKVFIASAAFIALFGFCYEPHPGSARQLQGIYITDNTLMKEGHPWVPHGFVFVGRLLPPKLMNRTDFAVLRLAAEKFSRKELDSAKSLGADVVRFQVSQPALNPRSPIYDNSYASYVGAAVSMARSAGLSVIISMQWQSGSGSYRESGVPDSGTVDAWDSMLAVIKGDPYVMYELFNEPKASENKEAAWTEWKRAFDELVRHFRSRKVRNVLIVDGLYGAGMLPGDLEIDDPLRSIAYAIHPYFNKAFPYGPRRWDGYFGNFCSDKPCIVTEWSAGTVAGCAGDVKLLSHELLSYLHTRKIGIIGWAFDYEGAIFDTSGTLSDYSNFESCAEKKKMFGPGALLRDYFLNEYSK